MADALKDLPPSVHPDLLVGFNKADDAGVYRIDERTALVQTVDFFPPIVDDPYSFGQIAAANALSDIYAMGGRPITALNIVGFPASKMPGRVLSDVLRGGHDKIVEAGAVVVGGHSVKDNELKYGVAVTGLIDPTRIVSNAGARPGDRLFLTKPLGTGIVTTGIKRNLVSPELTERVVRQMSELNRAAAELMLKFDVHAATDITGFGLLGHGWEMAAASEVGLTLSVDKVPFLDEAVRLAGEGCNPGGANDNRDYLKERVEVSKGIDPNVVQVLYDPQTSGGLFIAIPADQAGEFSSALQQAGLWHHSIGEVISTGDPVIRLKTSS